MIEPDRLPPGWQLRRIGTILRKERRDAVPDAGVVTAYRDGQVTLRADRREGGYTMSAEQGGYQFVERGNFVFHGLDGFAGAVGVASASGNCSPVYHVCSAPHGDSPAYLAYALRAAATSGYLEALAANTRQRSIDFRNWETFASIAIPCPTPDEQKRIVALLDNQLAAGDEAMSLREQQIKMLVERSTAFAEEVLNREASEWVSLRRLTVKIGSGKTPRGGSDAYVESGVAFLRSQNVHNDGLRLDDVVYIDSATDRDMASTRVRIGDVLLNITGGSMGRATAVRTPVTANVSQHVCIVRLREPGMDEIIAAALSTQNLQTQMRLSQVGGNREGLNFEQVGNLRVPLVPSDRVEDVTRVIRARREATKSAVAHMLGQADLLRERKRALTMAAVTGAVAAARNGRGI